MDTVYEDVPQDEGVPYMAFVYDFLQKEIVAAFYGKDMDSSYRHLSSDEVLSIAKERLSASDALIHSYIKH